MIYELEDKCWDPKGRLLLKQYPLLGIDEYRNHTRKKRKKYGKAHWWTPPLGKNVRLEWGKKDRGPNHVSKKIRDGHWSGVFSKNWPPFFGKKKEGANVTTMPMSSNAELIQQRREKVKREVENHIQWGHRGPGKGKSEKLDC